MQGAHFDGRLGEDEQRHPDEAVGAELQEHGGQDHRALRGGLGVGVGQPGVEREHRHLDAEAHEHAAEDQDLRGAAPGRRPTLPARRRRSAMRRPSRSVSPPATKNTRHEAHDHQRRAEQRVEEELDRGVLALLAAPHADHEVHRQQHDLEEDEEQDEVLGHEGAEHAGVEHEDEDEERLRVVRLGEVVPAVDDHQRGDQQRERDQRQRQPVDPDEVVRVDDLDPRLVDDELQARRRRRSRSRRSRRRRRRPRPALAPSATTLMQLLLALGDEHHHAGPPPAAGTPSG